jgi:TRAP-type C4-dicarboxylate transport system permease small subunit
MVAKAGDAKAPAADDELDDDLGEDDLGDDDQFANLADIDTVAKKSADAIPQGGPPPPGSFAAWAVAFIDDLKLDWIDIFLRQLVIIVAFFGAMLATQRGKHINIDALSKMLPPRARRVVGVLLPLTAVAVCLVLARAGWDLVRISREYPKDLLPSVPEWSLQLMFPVGFGLLAVHFVVRAVEAVAAPPSPGDARQAASEKGGQG